MEAAEKYATSQPGGRLATPLLGILDEAANVCRWKALPDQYSHYGSRGIILMTILQSWSQGVEVWSLEGMRKLWSASNVKIYGGGTSEVGYLPDGGGHRAMDRVAGKKNKTGTAANRRPGYAYLHNAVDDHSRFAYTEILEDEKKETAAGITVKRVLTDNGSCYRSHAFKDALGPDITHKRTRPYRSQTNGKVERFNRTMLEEWAYARPYASEAERVAAFPGWLHDYNHRRGHTSLKGQPPASRAARKS